MALSKRKSAVRSNDVRKEEAKISKEGISLSQKKKEFWIKKKLE